MADSELSGGFDTDDRRSPGAADRASPRSGSALSSVFPPLAQSAESAARPALDMVLDIPVQLTVELGRSKMPIRKLLQLAHGSVVELDRLAGEPLDLLVNGRLIGHGEVVVVNDKLGIRLTEVIGHDERLGRAQR
jgi:flagellar motor switch protein FliN